MSIRRKFMIISLLLVALFFLAIDGVHLASSHWGSLLQQFSGQQDQYKAYAKKTLPALLSGDFQQLRPALASDLSADDELYFKTKLKLISAQGPVVSVSPLHLLRYQVNSQKQWDAVYVLYVRHQGYTQADRLTMVVSSPVTPIKPRLVGLSYNFSDKNLLQLLATGHASNVAVQPPSSYSKPLPAGVHSV